MRRFLLPVAALGLVALCAACSAAAPSASAPLTSAAALAPTTAPTSEPAVSGTVVPASATAQAAGGGGDAAALCALIIDINTRGGYMVNKTYNASPTAEQLKAITLETVARKDKIVSLVPPDLRDGMAEQLAYLQALADWAVVNGWVKVGSGSAVPTLPPDFLAKLEAMNAFQKKRPAGVDVPMKGLAH